MAKPLLWENPQTQSERLMYQSAEQPIKGAPSINMTEGLTSVPQHFLAYSHSLESLGEIVQDIQFDRKYPIFVGEEHQQLYVQIGIIGRNNYKHPENANPNHIVYGRKWRVESNLPSGEIVQTVFLALKKAREHEIRELLQLQSAQYLKTSAPFSGHQDLGILARLNPVSDQTDELNFERQLKHAFQRIQFDWHKLQLVELQKLPRGNYYLEVRFEADPEREAGSIAFPELIGRNIELIVGKASTNACLQALVRKLIELSDQHTDQHFYYRGTTIFSPDLDIEAVADISIQLRTQEALNCQRFEAEFRAINFQVDSTRVPQIAKEQLAKQDQLAGLQGHLPLGL